MSDDEKVNSLLESIADAVNKAQLPLSVKSLALENILFRVQGAMQAQAKAQSREQKEKEG